MEPSSQRRRSLLIWGLYLGGPVLLLVGYFTAPSHVFGPEHPVRSWVTLGVALAVLAGLLLHEIRRELLGLPGHPGMMIVLLSSASLVVFATTYLGLARDPGEFKGLETRIDALYFTVITMSTVGYGDIAAIGQPARVVVMVQILYTLIFLTAGATAASRRLHTLVTERISARSGIQANTRSGEETDQQGDG